jgi:hypothetical protein
MYLGQIRIDDNLTFCVNTHTPATGAAVDADAVPGYRIYEDETAAPILTGNMALLDDANTVGFYSEQIAVTVANGFEAGKSYTIRITGVVAGVTGVELHSFTVTAYDTDDIEGQTDDIGVAGAGLTALPAMVWASAARTLTSFGTLVADAAAAVWTYTTRTLTQSAASVAAAVAGSSVTVTRGDSWSVSLTGLGNIAARSKLWLTVKASEHDADTAAIVQIEETAGLVYLNGAAPVAPVVAADADITVNDAALGNITITAAARATAGLALATLHYDVQMLTAAGAVTTLTTGVWTISADYTRATS